MVNTPFRFFLLSLDLWNRLHGNGPSLKHLSGFGSIYESSSGEEIRERPGRFDKQDRKGNKRRKL